MPEESPAEVSAMQILEASSYVRSFLAQPHRLEITVSGLSQPMIYFPDLEIRADLRLARALERRAFWQGCARMATPSVGRGYEPNDNCRSKKTGRC